MSFASLLPIALLVGLASALILTPVAILVARRLGAMDQPNALAIHTQPTPRLGGLGIFGAALVALAVGLLSSPMGGSLGWGGLLLAFVAIVAVGVLDDLRRLSPKTRLLGQLGAGVIAVVSGVSLSPAVSPVVLGGAAALFYLVGGANALNLLDGMNGLAGGLTAIAAAFLALLALQSGHAAALMLGAALAGACLGFLPYNFPRARTFMGDGGSLFLGFSLGAIAVLLTAQAQNIVQAAAPLLVLGLPIADVILAVIRRALRRADVLAGDRYHMYDLLHHAGLPYTATVIMMYTFAIGFGLSALLLRYLPFEVAIGVCVFEGVTFFGTFLWWNLRLRPAWTRGEHGHTHVRT
ncbi:MAG: undecaprenyl/decaprenyl-phosphate alpha-N-acetylglucosaminyl 1-phosphate transferase [Chloroflexi bacterium]|nr:undecaprenyl/decaprenyl-phosphate alpha-N-acetylglucosaminyl 1-phosphate transferase [Chloroflexota bacterium]